MKKHWMFLSCCACGLGLALSANTFAAQSIYGRSSSTAYPAVSVYYENISPSLQQSCDELNSSGKGVCRANKIRVDSFQKRLSNARLFSKVQHAERNVDYAVTFATALFNTGGSVEGSLARKNIVYEIAVLWRGLPLSHQEYIMPYEQQSLNANKLKVITAGDHAKKLTEKFLRDTRETGVFTAEYLLEKLQATNYEQELKYPEKASGFTLASTRQYHDPILGTRLHYVHDEKKTAALDVFVYPVRQTNWKDVDEILLQESNITRQQLELAKNKKYFSKLHFSENELRNWSLKNKSIRGLTQTAHLADTERTPYRNFLYLFLVEDKLIKIQATIPKKAPMPAPTEFIHSLLEKITVPIASPYMVKLRQQKIKQEAAISSTDE